MHFFSTRGLMPYLAAMLASAMLGNDARAQDSKDVPDNPPAIRKALEQKVTLDFEGNSLNDALDHLSQKTKIKIIFDYYATQQILQYAGVGGGGLYGALGAFGFPGGNPIPGTPGFPSAPVEKGAPGTVVKISNGKARTALQNLINEHNNLNNHNLTFVIVGDTVVVTTEERGHLRQLRQSINVDIKGQTLADALKKVADETGINLIIDPRQAEKAKAKMDLKLEDVTLETALRLMTEFGDLAWVSVGNVVLVTSAERAEKLRKENEASKTKATKLAPSPYGGVNVP
ncbi:MAG TPA: hypothetical protein VE988_28280 [Gemmataceae bacterium]|nr:hypothetical protein [Gemmataceae bacterium]